LAIAKIAGLLFTSNTATNYNRKLAQKN